MLRVSHQDLQEKLKVMQDELSNTNTELEKSRNLILDLENDLEKVQKEAANTFPTSTMSVAGTYASKFPQPTIGGRRGRASSPTSSIISGFDPQVGPQNSTDSLRGGEAVGGGSGILPMVTAQRDRFKKKNSDLETELANTYQTISSLRTEVSSLQKDNLNLYEKTRYVSTFNRSHTPQPNAASFYPSASITSSSDAPSGLSLDRYRSTYEQNLSPFAAFRGRESARAFKRMSLPERVVYQITRMVLATRTSRNLFAAYCLALHWLVLGMLYWISSSNIERQISNLGDPGASHVGHTDANGDWVQDAFNDG